MPLVVKFADARKPKPGDMMGGGGPMGGGPVGQHQHQHNQLSGSKRGGGDMPWPVDSKRPSLQGPGMRGGPPIGPGPHGAHMEGAYGHPHNPQTAIAAMNLGLNLMALGGPGMYIRGVDVGVWVWNVHERVCLFVIVCRMLTDVVRIPHIQQQIPLDKCSHTHPTSHTALAQQLANGQALDPQQAANLSMMAAQNAAMAGGAAGPYQNAYGQPMGGAPGAMGGPARPKGGPGGAGMMDPSAQAGMGGGMGGYGMGGGMGGGMDPAAAYVAQMGGMGGAYGAGGGAAAGVHYGHGQV